MELILTVFPLKTWIFAAGFGGLFTIFKTKYQNFKLGKEYENNLKEIKKNYFYAIRNDLKTNKDKYITENLADYDTRKLKETIQQLFKEEKIFDLMSKRVKEFINNMKFETHTSYFNILILGSTGVGKSTLINSVLKLDKHSNNYAKCGRGEPVTLGEPHPYISEKVKGLKLWDSQGIDKSKYDINHLKESVINLINQNAKENNPDNFIHCLWYCVSGHRFEKIEREFLTDLMKIYHDETLPIVIVYTQCISEKDGKEMSKEIDKICMEQKRKIKVIPILAKDKKIGTKDNPNKLNKFGIDKLLEYSFEKIEGAVQSACFHSIREQINNNHQKSLKKNEKKIENSLNAHLKAINKSIPLNQLKDKILKLFEIIMKILIFEEDETITISEKSKLNLLNFLEEYTQTCTTKLNNFMQQKVIEKSLELATSYLMNQKDAKEKSDKINQGILNSLTNSILENISICNSIGLNTGAKELNEKYKEFEEWKKISEDEISKEFNQKIEIFFNQGITKFIKDKFTEILSKCMTDSFEAIFKNIDAYMVEKLGEQVKVISKNIIDQIKVK